MDFVNIVQEPFFDIQAERVSTLSIPEPVVTLADEGTAFIAEKGAEGNIALMGYGDSLEGPIAYHLLYSPAVESEVEILSGRPFPEDSYPGGRHTAEVDSDHGRLVLRDEDVYGNA